MANIIFIIFFLVCFACTIGEPQCSPFHYHEQLLEKMVEVKHRMGLYAENMEKWENAMNDKLAELDEKLEQQAQWERQFTTSVEKRLSNFNETVANALLDIKAEGGRSPILFKAKQPKDKSPTEGDTIVFQEIVQNDRGGYDKDTGIFTAPVSGTYLFTTQFCLYQEKELSVNIIANGKVITAANFGDKVWAHMCSTTDGVASISSGDEVKVQVTYRYSGTVIYPDHRERYWSYFSGVRLHP